MFWFSLGVVIGQNEKLLLLSHLVKTYRFGDLKIEFQSSVYIFSGCWSNIRFLNIASIVQNVFEYFFFIFNLFLTQVLRTSWPRAT